MRRSIGSQVLSTLDSFALSLTQDFNASLETIGKNNCIVAIVGFLSYSCQRSKDSTTYYE